MDDDFKNLVKNIIVKMSHLAKYTSVSIENAVLIFENCTMTRSSMQFLTKDRCLFYKNETLPYIRIYCNIISLSDHTRTSICELVYDNNDMAMCDISEL